MSFSSFNRRCQSQTNLKLLAGGGIAAPTARVWCRKGTALKQ